MVFNIATGLSTILPPVMQSQPALSLDIQPVLGGDSLPMPPTSALGAGVIKDGGFGGACQDAEAECWHCKRKLNESSYKCKIEDGGCRKVWNSKCSDSNCHCQDVTA